MKKLIATAAAAAALMLTASPAVAQVKVAIGVQYGDQNAAASDGSTAEATNELSITQNQANAGLGEIDDLNQGTDYVGDVLIFY